MEAAHLRLAVGLQNCSFVNDHPDPGNAAAKRATILPERAPIGEIDASAKRDKRAEKTQRRAARRARRRERRASRHSRAALAGRPLHAFLTPFPIAFFTAVPVSDIAYAATSDSFWPRVSLFLLYAGLATGVLASLVGVVDFFAIRRARRLRQGWLHAATSLVVLALVVANMLLRWDFQAAAVVPSGVILSVITFLLLVMAQWYGATISYRHGIGVREAPAAGASRPGIAPPTKTGAATRSK